MSSSWGRISYFLIGFAAALWFWTATGLANGQAWDPSLAVVRISSHGASGTVIASGPGKSYILSCCHMLCDEKGKPSEQARRGPFKSIGSAQPYAIKSSPPAGQKPQATMRLLAWDYAKDLSLFELDNGPFYSIPLAPAGHTPSQFVLSVGYDDMGWPVTQRQATILKTTGDIIWTKEYPHHGRSGGCLVDMQSQRLIGVVQGYRVLKRWPDNPRAPWLNDKGIPQEGMYISHACILQFLARHSGQQQQQHAQPQRQYVPQPMQYAPPPQYYYQPIPQQITLPQPRGGGC